tara:strand:+ start:80 stop:418 length:339 start_codon:yes stop_codon:yes gene_type:complete
MSFIREPSKCPKCYQRTYTVTESRTPGRTKTYLRRRRKRCTHCGHRDTTYEITAEEYEEYLINKKLIDKLKATLTTKEKRSCYQCKHYYSNSCRLEIPELDAEECSYFVINQ